MLSEQVKDYVSLHLQGKTKSLYTLMSHLRSSHIEVSA